MGGSGPASCHVEGRGAAASCCDARQRAGKEGPTSQDRANCAVCFFAVRVTPPPVYDYRLTELGLRELLPVPPPVVGESVLFAPTYYGRGPPVG
jgi:hypothetical protein